MSQSDTLRIIATSRIQVENARRDEVSNTTPDTLGKYRIIRQTRANIQTQVSVYTREIRTVLEGVVQRLDHLPSPSNLLQHG